MSKVTVGQENGADMRRLASDGDSAPTSMSR
jgi:hypothetical protein